MNLKYDGKEIRVGYEDFRYMVLIIFWFFDLLNYVKDRYIKDKDKWDFKPFSRIIGRDKQMCFVLENELDKIRGMITAEPTKYGLFYSFYKLS